MGGGHILNLFVICLHAGLLVQCRTFCPGMRELIWVHVRADMGSCEQAVMGFGITSSISPGN